MDRSDRDEGLERRVIELLRAGHPGATPSTPTRLSPLVISALRGERHQHQPRRLNLTQRSQPSRAQIKFYELEADSRMRQISSAIQ